MSNETNRAYEVAEKQLSDSLPRRWIHVQAVAEKAKHVGDLLLDSHEQDILVASAILHDVGYSAELARTGFHPLDGARWLNEIGFSDRVVALVAHHSCAELEADERGFVEELQVFPNEGTLVTDALWYSDMTTGPDGQDFDVEERLAEIKSRYGPDHLVTRFITRASGKIISTARRIEALMAESRSQA